MTTDNKDGLYSSEEFQAYFKTGNRSLIMKANLPLFTVLAVSDKYLALVHKQRSEVLNYNLFEVFPGSAADASEKNSVFSSFKRVIDNKETDELPTFKYEIYNEETGRHQTEHWTNVNEPIFDKEGNVAYIINTTTNITQQVLAKQALEETGQLKAFLQREQALNEELASANEELRAVNEELHQSQESLFTLTNELEERVASRTTALTISEGYLRSVFEQAPLAFCILRGPNLIIELANDRMLKLWHKTPGVIGKPHHQVRSEPETAPFLKILDDVYVTGIPFTGHEVKAYTAPGNDKEWGYFSFVYQPIRDDEGNITGILALVDDVTEAVESRLYAQQSEQTLQLAIEAANFGTWHIDTQTRVFIASPRLKQLFGFYADEEVTLQGCINQITEEYQDYVTKAVEVAITRGGNYDLTYSAKGYHDGIIRWLRAVGNLAVDANGEFSAFTGVIMDITDQVSNTQQIQSLNEELTVINEELSSSNEELLLAQNDLFTSNKQLSESEDRFRNMAESAGVYIAVGDATGNATYFNKSWSVATGRSTEDLLRFGWVDLVHPEDKEQYVNIYLDAFKEKIPFTGEFRLQKQDGGYIWLLANGYPRFLSDGSFAGYISSSIDITERKKDDQRKNDFIGMVSHEMKTPLTSLSGYLQLLEARVKSEDVFAINMLGKAGNQINRITRLINGFLNVSRLESGKIQIDKKRFDMAHLIKEAEEEVISTINSHKIIFHPVETIFVNADRDKINHVISNLINNAVKYSPASTVINVACITLNGCATVSVKDKGIGIKKEDQPKLFDRYYRVNNDNVTSASGFGIGLYLCAEIIQRHDGKIWVESEVGKGSRFTFNLPVIES